MKRNIMDAVPPMPDGFTQRMNRTLRQIEENEHMKMRHHYGALAIALALILALAGVAYAATRSGILDRLFPGSTPPPEVEQAVVRNAGSAEKDGLKLTMDEYLFDGASAHFGWTVESTRDEPVYYLTEYEFFDGGVSERMEEGWGTGGYASSDAVDDCLVMLSGKARELGLARSHSGDAGFVYGSDLLPEEPIQMTVTIWAFTSDLTPVLVMGEDEDMRFLEEGNPLIERLSQNEQIGVTPKGFSRVAAYPQYAAALEAEREATHQALRTAEKRPTAAEVMGAFDHVAQSAHASSGLLKPLTMLSVTVEIDPTEANGLKHTQATQREFELPSGRLVIDMLDFNMASTRIRYRYYKKEPFKLDDWSGKWWFLLVDPDGKPMNVDISLGMSGSSGVDEQGEKYVEVYASGNPVSKVPEYVRFVPAETVADAKVDMPPSKWYQHLAGTTPEEETALVYIQ